jgi:hypothetical protein
MPKTAIYSDPEAQKTRRVISMEESEQTEKTLHHLAGRIEELRARLERVLVPVRATGNGSAEAKLAAEAASPLTDRLRTFRHLAQTSIDNVEDILNRLDV